LTRIALPLIAAALAAATVSGDVRGADGTHSTPTFEVVVTAAAPPLSAFGRSLATARHGVYARRTDAARRELERRVVAAIPGARVRWRYRLTLNGFAVVLPRSSLARLRQVPGIETVWPSVSYRQRLDRSPGVIGADKLWGPGLATAGQGMKIGIIDDGLDATHPFFSPAGFAYPPGFPKGQTQATTPKVIVQRTFAPASPRYANANLPFDPEQSFHATHVAGIAAGDNGTKAGTATLSGIAPLAYLGNYKALTTPTPGFGLDGNAAEIAAAIEAAVADGMNVINLSLGEPEVEPSRDIVVQAINGAAAAGVIPVVAAGNDHDEFGDGSVSSPGSASGAITVAATSKADVIASFSSGGPTPVSLHLKPDVSAPGLSILSSLPRSGGLYGQLSGTSMASPHIAGAAALLKERHPGWTTAQVKSALVQTGDPVHGPESAEVATTREGGGLANLPRADVPLLFATPTGVGLQLNPSARTATATVALSDAGGGAGAWTATVAPQSSLSGLQVVTGPQATVPGTLQVTASATAATPAGAATGFVILSRGSDVRRVPYWIGVFAPRLARERHVPLTRPGIYSGTTVGAPALVSRYRYPTGGDIAYPGPERAYRVTVGRVANFGVVLLRGHTVPHVTFPGNEDHLAGYTGLPLTFNPYFGTYGTRRPIAGAVLPAPGSYDVVFDTPSGLAAGPFTFRYWVNDTTPPRLRVASLSGRIAVTASDAGSGIDPQSIVARLDGKRASVRYAAGRIVIPAVRGTHRLVLEVSDLQETKNMENVARITPNTTTLTASVRLR